MVPLFNEQEVLPEFHRRLGAVLDALDHESEIVFVDDGSRDASPRLLEDLVARDPRVQVLTLSRNFGHQAALCCGLDHATGDVVVSMDGDLQDSPELIPRFLDKWREGYAVVYAQRRRIHEGIVKRVVYALYYRLLRALASTEIALDSGDFCLLDRKVVDQLRALPERTVFLRGLRSWVGFRQAGIEHDRPARQAGQSKYPLVKLLKLGFDGVLSFSTAPLRLALLAGVLVSVVAFVWMFVIIYLRVRHLYDLPGWASLMSGMLFLGGIQLITIGIVGEYIARIYDEVKRRPLYLVARAARGRDASATTATSPAASNPAAHRLQAGS